MIYYIEMGILYAPYVFLGINAHQALRTEDKQAKIIHLLWALIFLLAAIADAVVK